jgi:hypothetical protein
MTAPSNPQLSADSATLMISAEVTVLSKASTVHRRVRLTERPPAPV